MIKSQDRSGWFGASDTKFIMGDYSNKGFTEFWLIKNGLLQKNFQNNYTKAGTMYEHKILDFIGVKKKDRQIKIKKLRLRVNLDGEDHDTVYEVKTHKNTFVLTKAYWQQTQVEMYASKKKCVLIAYHLLEEDYKNYFNPIIDERLSKYSIAYDAMWIKNCYLPRLSYLTHCLLEGLLPSNSGLLEWVAVK